MKVMIFGLVLGLVCFAGIAHAQTAKAPQVKPPAKQSSTSSPQAPAQKLPPGVSADWTTIDWKVVAKALNADTYQDFTALDVQEAVAWSIHTEWQNETSGLVGLLNAASGKKLECTQWKKEVLKKLLTPEPAPKGYDKLRDAVDNYFEAVRDSNGNLEDDLEDPCR